jgi:hypothetical protein
MLFCPGALKNFLSASSALAEAPMATTGKSKDGSWFCGRPIGEESINQQPSELEFISRSATNQSSISWPGSKPRFSAL